MSSAIKNSPSKVSVPKGSPEERSKTPKKQVDLLFKTSQRTSKSLIKGESNADNVFSLVSKMEPIKELGESYRYYYLGKGNGH